MEGNSAVQTIIWAPQGYQSDLTRETALPGSVAGAHVRRAASLAQTVAEASERLRGGELVAFPTETVYGLGGAALQEGAVRAIFAAKRRPVDNPLIAHVASREQVAQVSDEVSPLAARLMDAFWPGPLSILLPAVSHLPVALTAGLPTVAVRMPSHPVALALIAATGQPLAAPSANLSGRPSPTTAAHVLEDLQGVIAGVLDGGSCEVGIESTVVSVEDGQIMILRPGLITRDQLLAFSRHVVWDPHLLTHSEAGQPRAPGQKYVHYAPRGEVMLISGKDRHSVHLQMRERAQATMARGLRTALFVLAPAPQLTDVAVTLRFQLGAVNDPAAVTRQLYAALRAADEAQCEVIIAEYPPDDKDYHALRNRMLKAAGGSVVNASERA